MEERGEDGNDTLKDDPASAYQEIKKRLLRFKETTQERELRVQGEWEYLIKTRNVTGLQFEAMWESKTRELEKVGLGLNPKRKYAQYLLKVGKEFAETIRTARRAYLDERGGTVTRVPVTLEEAHIVVLDCEAIRSGSHALNAARTGGRSGGVRLHDPGQQSGHRQAGVEPDKGKGGKRPDSKGKGKGKSDDTCFNFKNTGQCKFGDTCRYKHEGPAKAVGARTK